jgi:hypothetical protein
MVVQCDIAVCRADLLHLLHSRLSNFLGADAFPVPYLHSAAEAPAVQLLKPVQC